MTDQQVAEIARLIDELCNKKCANDLLLKAYKLQRKLAREYGIRNGWILSKDYLISDLVNGMTPSKLKVMRSASYDDRFNGTLVDHEEYYIDNNGKAVAVVCHNYGEKEESEQWASEHGLFVRFPTDFPSWYYPSRTTLTVYYRNNLY